MIVNGMSESLQEDVMLHDLIASRGLDPSRVVAELNREIVPGEDFPKTRLQEGDRLELLQFVGGG
ncbi:sulfur carrier protein ThiS [Desulfonatronum lacustre]|uniref:sulfur carrier protein ThiS n=1 Tax=Desulfonatronum lacustre TaxID=66849 RepID=UPI001FE0D647|nr:sulfur carrier protein ThiS [Desulfonatronum lacustre]